MSDPKRLVYVDESGDPGLNIAAGAAPVFAVAAVVFDSPEDAEETAEAIRAYRGSIGRGQQFVFRFADLRHERRLGFLRAVCECPFRVRASVMEKSRIAVAAGPAHDPAEAHLLAVRLLHLEDLAGPASLRVFVDGRHQARWLREHRRGLGAIKFAEKRNVLVQLADVAAGAIARAYDPTRKGGGVYRDALAARIEAVRELTEEAAGEG